MDVFAPTQIYEWLFPEPRAPPSSLRQPRELVLDPRIPYSHSLDRILASPSPNQSHVGAQRRRRTSSAASKNISPSTNLSAKSSHDRLGTSSGTGGYGQPLPPIPSTPHEAMSLSRSPSPQRGGGWSSPGLTYESGRASPRKTYGDIKMNGAAGTGITWESAKARSDEVKGYPSITTQNQGFFSRHLRRISTSLPTFNTGRRDFSDKEKLGRGRWTPSNNTRTGRILSTIGRMIWRMRLKLGIVLGLFLLYVLFYASRKSISVTNVRMLTNNLALHRMYRRASWLGGGNKYVIILAANQGGGVMEWKGPREWAIERDSVKNKKRYAKKWGYELEIVDMSTKKRYAHEWRESWEKVDTIRNCMRKYPKAEWYASLCFLTCLHGSSTLGSGGLT